MKNIEPPEILVMKELEFTALLRANNIGTCPQGITLYRSIVRDNIQAVLENVFPLFFSSLNDIEIKSLVNLFLLEHPADQPEFHQIATELLIFMRCQPFINIALIEYEWLLYAVEIEDVYVPMYRNIKPYYLDTQDDIKVKINPTLKIIAVPFCLKSDEESYESTSSLHYYALYRKHSNKVFRRELNMLDVELLMSINDLSINFKNLKRKACEFMAEESFHSWLVDFNNDECLSLIFVR